MSHAFFGNFPWSSLRDGEASPPLVPDADVINAGSIEDAGGANEAALDGGKPSAAHTKLFRDWAWRDEALMQREILDALARDAQRKPSWWTGLLRSCCPCAAPHAEAEELAAGEAEGVRQAEAPAGSASPRASEESMSRLSSGVTSNRV